MVGMEKLLVVKGGCLLVWEGDLGVSHILKCTIMSCKLTKVHLHLLAVHRREHWLNHGVLRSVWRKRVGLALPELCRHVLLILRYARF